MQEKRRSNGILFLIFLLVLLFPGFSAPAAERKTLPEGKDAGSHILIITSQPYVTKWFISLDHAFSESIHKVLSAPAKVSYEYMDGKKLADPRFLATMSHELRTPLNSIIGFTGILLQGLVGPLNDEQRKQLQWVRTSANHLLALISDILDISKIEAGKLQLSRETFDLRAAIDKIVQTFRPLTEKKGLRLEAAIAPEEGELYSDARRVEQINFNLLRNAAKFTDAGSITVSCATEDGKYLIRVADTGIGVKKDQIDEMFKPFRHIDTGLSRKYEGTGLRLSICKKLLELLGGEIGVESEWQRGTIVTVSIPVERRPT